MKYIVLVSKIVASILASKSVLLQCLHLQTEKSLISFCRRIVKLFCRNYWQNRPVTVAVHYFHYSSQHHHFHYHCKMHLYCLKILITTLFFYKNQSILFEAGCSWFIFIFEAEMFLSCSYFPDRTLQCYKDDVRLSDIKAHYFISFILFPSSRAHRQPLGGVLQKIGSATVLKPIKKYLQRSSIFH